MTASTGTTETLSDATADSLALTRAAMLERCGITVQPWSWPDADWETASLSAVIQDNQILNVFRDDDAAYAFAYELAGECIEQGDLTP